MFTGIVQATCTVAHIEDLNGLRRLHLAIPEVHRGGLAGGESIAVNGVCLTVARLDDTGVGFDVIAQTLAHTNLGALAVGSRVNIERSMTAADEIGGHRVSGHVSDVARVAEVLESENNRVIRFTVAPLVFRYVFDKGFIALDGASLTVAAVDAPRSAFEVHLIPETLERTVLSERAVGDAVNVEIESETRTVVDTLERLLSDPDFRARTGIGSTFDERA